MTSSNNAGDGHTTFDELCEPINSFLEQHEGDHPPHHRETLHFAAFVKKLIYHFTKNCEPGRQLVTDLETAPPELELGGVKRSTFFDAFQRFPVVWVDMGKSNEKKALLEMLEVGVTYIADRGYLSFPLMAAIAAADAFFIIRAKANLVYQRMERLPVTLPDTVRHIFQHVTDQRVRLTNAKDKPIYRLVSFHVGRERYLILTNRLELTTFQIILLYAYRWQVELIFRFLKRSLNGLHLLSQSKEGVTIHFYALLTTALLELHLKQKCVTICDAMQTTSASPESTDDIPAIAGLMIDPELLAGARGSTFLATVGEKLKRHWKISRDWLTALRNFLHQPFNRRVVLALGHY